MIAYRGNALQRALEEIERLDDPGEIYRLAFAKCRDLGVIRQSAHLTPRSRLPNAVSVAVCSDGYSDDWVELYENADFRAKDPIPARTIAHGSMLKWSDAMKLQKNSAAHEEYFVAMKDFGLIHGCGIPLYGPDGRETYASFDFGKPIEDIKPMTVGTVRAIAQCAFQRISILLKQTQTLPKLSKREGDVLKWIAQGKSVSSIAVILDLSPESVKTYVRRLYTKMEVSDRAGLVLKANRSGILRW
ncbi:LuxR family transcriptional regulator [Erythrobacter sp. YT30]|uniref:helix-turn-helix transcriptional regulator n=1 Tax=Erythrobacter sp. YT30 TaxID=1735012 RepID=UPI00076C8989|nr:LuxR family transcriptional regulator [Erythrobacter sp. YT30]KWV93326.1 hypothetical protein AUC45_04240 [Erythrobacter sp. YT30]